MSFEKQHAYLEKSHAEFLSDSESEVEPDDNDASLEGDFEEIQNHDTDMEEEIEEPISEVLDVPQRVPHFIGKDGTTRWKKHIGNRQIQTRSDNLIKFIGISTTLLALLDLTT
ncbi:uncharacterized protein [Diabrotica undecimpunctata]|uniref:uncharacterized protein n=1 Tax=Diabrotica undecimpunctata TaxID=50387 RepID=UPI003B635BB4